MKRKSATGEPIAKGKPALSSAILSAVGGLVFLLLVESQQSFTEIDLEVARWVRSLSVPGFYTLFNFVNIFTASPITIALWILAMGFFILRGRPLEAIAVFLISGLWIGNNLLGWMMGRPSSSPELIPVVAFYALLTFLTLNNVRGGRLRVVVPVVSIFMIGLIPVARVYFSAHWPSDVLSSYILVFMGVAAILWVYTGVKNDRLRPPGFWRKKPEPEALEGKRVAWSIASTVYLDPQAGTATKEYKPPWPIRTLYWLAFQAPFPYQSRKEALQAAAAKRKIAGLLTRHQFSYEMVAPSSEILNGGDNYRFVTEFVPGDPPKSNREIEDTLSELYEYFQEVGLPTWQISPGNPHAYSNFIRDPEGDLRLIDLESALVSFSAPWKQMRASLRDGNFPIFDDVDFVRLRAYVEEHAEELTGTLGHVGLVELEQGINSSEVSTRGWKDAEPRIWGRLASRIYRLIACLTIPRSRTTLALWSADDASRYGIASGASRHGAEDLNGDESSIGCGARAKFGGPYVYSDDGLENL